MAGRAGGEEGVRFAACLRASSEGGHIKVIGETLVVSGADSAVTLICASATSFREANLAAYATERARAAMAKGWTSIVADHEREYRAYFDRVELEPWRHKCSGRIFPPTKDLSDSPPGRTIRALAALYFQFGRYLPDLIEPGRAALPANAQGGLEPGFHAGVGGEIHH